MRIEDFLFLIWGQLRSPRGEKTEGVLAAVERQVNTIRVADLQAECPGVGGDLAAHGPILGQMKRYSHAKVPVPF
jgi:hypothetical protein